MKVLHVNLNYDQSSLYEKFNEGLVNNGCNISVYNATMKSKELKNPPTYLKQSFILNRFDRLFFRNRNRKIMKDITSIYKIDNYDVIHAHSLFSNGMIAYSLKKKYKLPYVVAVRNTDINMFFKKMLHMRKLGVEILEHADKIIFLSNAYKSYVLKKYIPEKLKQQIENKSTVIPNGIDKFWHENKMTDKNIKIKDKIKLISVGDINKNKNQLTTIKACQFLTEKKDFNVELILIGEIKDKKYFEKLEKYNFVTYIPKVSKENLIDYYKNSHIFIMPSLYETFGLVYAEAMSQGLPVLYSKGQGFDEQFKDGLVGYSVCKKNPIDISEKLLKTLENYQQMSHNCIELVNRFNWDEISIEYINIYKKINEKRVV